MKDSWGSFEVCDCHSHVYGPFAQFPLSEDRIFDPPESPIESLEAVWKASGISRAVLVQGSACGNDHRAMLHAIARDPERRRGVAILDETVSDSELADLHRGGVRAIRVNWVKHLLRSSTESPSSMLNSAGNLARRVFALGWHIEVHVDPDSLDMVEQLEIAPSQIIVIDHVGRVDATLGLGQPGFHRLQSLLDREHIWVKLSGADRASSRASSLSAAAGFLASLASQVPDRCVWGLDWPHVNLAHVHADHVLRRLLLKAIPDPDVHIKILSENPARLYGFPPSREVEPAAVNDQLQGAGFA